MTLVEVYETAEDALLNFDINLYIQMFDVTQRGGLGKLASEDNWILLPRSEKLLSGALQDGAKIHAQTQDLGVEEEERTSKPIQ